VLDVDLALEKQPTERVGDRGQQRRGDAVWRVRFRNGWLYLLVILEFQSFNDHRMALRNLEYTALLYQELGRRGELGQPGRWPPVLPIVLYNGDAPWTATLEMRELIPAGGGDTEMRTLASQGRVGATQALATAISTWDS